MRRHIPQLDGLRGLAALIVLVSHASNAFGIWQGRLGHGAGQTGVMLFFVLSGFLMTYLHADAAFDLRGIGAYAARRVARVYPLFAVAACLFALQAWLRAGGGAPGTLGRLAFRQLALLDPGISVLWTIHVEITFYFAFLALWAMGRFCGRRFLVGVVLLLILAGSESRLAYASVFWGTSRYFLFGVLAALIPPLTRLSGGLAGSALALLALLSLPLGFPMIAHALFGRVVQPWSSDLVALQVALAFTGVLIDGGVVAAAFSSRPARWLGRVSYSLYLLQPFVLDFLRAHLGAQANPMVAGAAALAFTLAAAAVSNALLERPLQAATLRVCAALAANLRAGDLAGGGADGFWW